MPLTPTACPNCGNILQANSLETAGAVGTPCRECGETVFVHTDEDGRVEAINTGSDGGAHHAAAFADEEGAAPFGHRRRVIPLIMAALALLLLVWAMNSVFCNRLVKPPLAEEIVIRTSPTPLATVTPYVLNRESGVTFETGKAQLTASSRDRLEDLVKRLLSVPRDRLFEIAGHADDTGNETLNVKLSQARAEAVREFLRGRGVPAEMLTVRGYGSAMPRSDNATPEGREVNRRIEIVPLTRTTRDLSPPER